MKKNMFDSNTWFEIWESIKRHKLRTFLTGFGVAWGIFILVLLLGMGDSFRKGINNQFAGFAQNTIMAFPGWTSESYEGMPANRRIKVTATDLELVRENVSGIKHISPETNFTTNRVYYGDYSGDFEVVGVYPEFFSIRLYDLTEGRYINPLDQAETRNVAFVGPKTLDVLFRGEEPIGQYLNIHDNYFRVVGVFSPTATAFQFGDDANRIFIPYSSFTQAFGRTDNIGYFVIGPESDASAFDIEDEMKQFLGTRLKFNPEDPRAIRTFNLEETTGNFNALFFGVQIFLWIVGLATLMGGVVGVGNIMLVTVKERTREFGIRKAIGATPLSIVGLVIFESIMITTISGYAGLLTGLFLLYGIRTIMHTLQMDTLIFAPPGIDLNIAIAATVVLILAGTLAGFFPARNAAKIKPVEAFRY
jgi:putative ABC transport system permease protein